MGDSVSPFGSPGVRNPFLRLETPLGASIEEYVIFSAPTGDICEEYELPLCIIEDVLFQEAEGSCEYKLSPSINMQANDMIISFLIMWSSLNDYTSITTCAQKYYIFFNCANIF